jgi:uncharacterized damage-inducible protein DinB
VTRAATVREHYLRHQRRLLAAVAPLDDSQIRARTGNATSIAFNLWHVARWADWLQCTLRSSTEGLRTRLGPRDEIWASEGLATRWGLAAATLGNAQTGMGMDEDVSATLPLPAKAELVAYAERAFAAVDAVLVSLDDELLDAPVNVPRERAPWMSPEKPRTVLHWILIYLDHGARHLGMVETLRGIAGLRGTATN